MANVLKDLITDKQLIWAPLPICLLVMPAFHVLHCAMWIQRSFVAFLPVRKGPAISCLYESVGLDKGLVLVRPDLLINSSRTAVAAGLDHVTSSGMQQAIRIPGSTGLSTHVRETHFNLSF